MTFGRRGFLGAAAAGMGACAAPRARESLPVHRAQDRLVILLTLDEVPADAFFDESLALPNLRALAARGAASRMTTTNPTTTWTNHASLATGVLADRHGVLFNGLLTRGEPGRPVRIDRATRAQLVRVPTLHDAAAAAGLATALVGWIPDERGPAVRFAFPEEPAVGFPLEEEVIAAGLVSRGQMRVFQAQQDVWKDDAWSRVALYLCRRHRPNLLMMHWLTTDTAHHNYGLGSFAGNAGLALADARVGALVRGLDDAGLGGRVTLFVLSDHGHRVVSRVLRPNALFRSLGWLDPAADGTIARCDVQAVPSGGLASIYVTSPERRSVLLPDVRARLEGLADVERVIEPGGYAALGLPRPEHNPQAPDLVVLLRAGCAVIGAPAGDVAGARPSDVAAGNHGYVATDPRMDALFVASGYGVRAGVVLPRVRNVDVAPTAAALLGFEMPGVGAPLEALLDARGVAARAAVSRRHVIDDTP